MWGRLPPASGRSPRTSPWGAKGWTVTPPSTLHSLRGTYRAFSQYVFGNFEDSGKLMGLAPYGRPGRFEEICSSTPGAHFVRRRSFAAVHPACQVR
jgi:carbamoyltransferase